MFEYFSSEQRAVDSTNGRRDVLPKRYVSWMITAFDGGDQSGDCSSGRRRARQTTS